MKICKNANLKHAIIRMLWHNNFKMLNILVFQLSINLTKNNLKIKVILLMDSNLHQIMWSNKQCNHNKCNNILICNNNLKCINNLKCNNNLKCINNLKYKCNNNNFHNRIINKVINRHPFNIDFINKLIQFIFLLYAFEVLRNT